MNYGNLAGWLAGSLVLGEGSTVAGNCRVWYR